MWNYVHLFVCVLLNECVLWHHFCLWRLYTNLLHKREITYNYLFVSLYMCTVTSLLFGASLYKFIIQKWNAVCICYVLHFIEKWLCLRHLGKEKRYKVYYDKVSLRPTLNLQSFAIWVNINKETNAKWNFQRVYKSAKWK